METYKNLPKLADRLKYLRRLKDLTQKDLADIAGTTQQAIQQAEAGKAQNPRYLHRISLELGISFEWLAMNISPEEVSPGKGRREKGLSDKERELITHFKTLPRKEQDLMLELVKSRKHK